MGKKSRASRNRHLVSHTEEQTSAKELKPDVGPESVVALRREEEQMQMCGRPTYWLKYFNDQLTEKNKLGGGSFGNVYKINHRNFGSVACKIFDHDAISSQEMSKEQLKAKREVNMMSQHNHPNIIQIFGILLQKPDRTALMDDIRVAGFITELMSTDLHDVIHKRDRTRRFEEIYTKTDAFEWTEQIAAALCFMHENKVIHRDIKPHNILLSKDRQQLKVGDFGLTREVARSMTECGTLKYMAPEAQTSKHFSEKADIYSFAITIWELFTRKIPYDGIQEIDIYNVIVQQKHRPSLENFKENSLSETYGVMLKPDAAEVKTAFNELPKKLETYWHDDPIQRPEILEIFGFFSECLKDGQTCLQKTEILDKDINLKIPLENGCSPSAKNSTRSIGNNTEKEYEHEAQHVEEKESFRVREQICEISTKKGELGKMRVRSGDLFGDNVKQLGYIEDNSPAQAVGFRENDIILSINRTSAVGASNNGLKEIMDQISSGEKVVYKLCRGYPKLDAFSKKKNASKIVGKSTFEDESTSAVQEPSTTTKSETTSALIEALTKMKKNFAEITETFDQLINLVPDLSPNFNYGVTRDISHSTQLTECSNASSENSRNSSRQSFLF